VKRLLRTPVLQHDEFSLPGQCWIRQFDLKTEFFRILSPIHIGRMPIAPKKTAGADQAHNPMSDACGIVDAQEHAP
jgi:hypothetical protein